MLTAPENQLDVTLDGEVTSFFEWAGAGRYRPDPRKGAMDGGQVPLRELYFGVSNGCLCVRVDGAGDAQIQFEFDGGGVSGEMLTPEFSKGRVIELRAPLLGPRFRLHVTHNGLPPVVVPSGAWLELEAQHALLR